MQFSERFWNALLEGAGWAVVFGSIPLIALAGLKWLSRKELRNMFPDHSADRVLTEEEREAFQDRWSELHESSIPVRLCWTLVVALSFPGIFLFSFVTRRKLEGVSAITTIVLSVLVYTVILTFGAYVRSK